ncbi:hypothetical protein BDY21DRAFT_375304 [Lineolata rhizophorae]|uniref:Uncharacterized protein n=1 Tax=Lineolata rhizophorae TaxID=578093 RepID=A0A6A6NMN7_9PEZI|nr:hypothetical protein BDY21DRAFT_375304 [Lineolata rhizophorae]
MTCNITNTPLFPEPLPLYTRDPETASTRSAAPSYRSEAPTYHSRRSSLVPPAEPLPSAAEATSATAPAATTTNSSNNSNTRSRTASSSSAPSPSSSSSSSSSSSPSSSAATRSAQPRQGLPSPRYAPGFHARPAARGSGAVGDVELSNYNVGAWISANSSHASRQYHAVASRRANTQRQTTAALLNGMTTTAAPVSPSVSLASLSHSLSGGSASAASGASAAAGSAGVGAASSSGMASASRTSSNASSGTAVSSGSESSSAGAAAGGGAAAAAAAEAQPASPLEDPHLVGEQAAAKARAQRMYREMCLRGEDGVRHEGKAWDFMMAQMADWEERERSWRRFRMDVGRTKLLGRRLGLARR